MTVREIVVATRNPAKLAQISRLLSGLPFRLLPPPEAVDVQVDESGGSFRENAARKARACAHVTGLPAITSDGGLEIPALGPHWCALTTRRSTGPDAPDTAETDDTRIARLLAIAADLVGDDRRVYWTEAVAIATPAALVGTWQASGAEGRLAEIPAPPGGPAGFWVDRLRYYPTLGKYHSELPGQQRAEIGDPWFVLRNSIEAALRDSLFG